MLWYCIISFYFFLCHFHMLAVAAGRPNSLSPAVLDPDFTPILPRIQQSRSELLHADS